MLAEAARSCTCFALSGLVKVPSGTTNPSSFNSAWARRASATWVFARSLSAVLALSFFGARDLKAGSDSACAALFDASFAACVDSPFCGATGVDCSGGRTRVLNGPPSWLGICTLSAWGTGRGCWSRMTGRTTTMSTISAMAPTQATFPKCPFGLSSRPLPCPPCLGPGGLDPLHDVGYGVERSKHHDSIIFVCPLPCGGIGFERVPEAKHIACRTRPCKGISQQPRGSAARQRKVGHKPSRNPVFQRPADAVDVLVPQHAEHGIGLRIKAHPGEVLREHARGLRIVRDVQNDRRSTGKYLEPRRKVHVRKTVSDVLHADRKTRAQRIERGKGRARVRKLAVAPERGECKPP